MENVTIDLLLNKNTLIHLVPLQMSFETNLNPNAKPDYAETLRKMNRFWDEGSDFIIARSKDVIGYAQGIERGEVYESEGIYVDLNFRGRGISKILKSAQISHARVLGCRSICTIVKSSNMPSIKLQRHFGFQIKPSPTGYSFCSLNLI